MRNVFVLSLIIAVLLADSLGAQTLPAVPGTPLNVIIDTDVGSDLDDSYAVAMALRLRQLGYFRIRALTSSTWLDKAPAYLNLLLKHGGLTTADIPVGAFQGARPAFTGGSCFGGDSADNYLNATLAAKLVAPDPDSVPNVGRASFPAALGVLRAALAASPNGSVIIVTLGGLTNISDLLQSAANAGGDGFASGQSLWDTKVVRMVSQLAGYPNVPPYTDSLFTSSPLSFNASCDAPAAKYVFEHNGAIPIIGNPMQVSMYLGGCYDGTGAGCTSAMPVLSPSRIATGYYRAAGGQFSLGAGNFGHSAWDPSAMFYGLVGTADPGGGAYFTLSANGTVTYNTVSSPASSVWSTSTSSNHYFAINVTSPTPRWQGQQTAMTTLLMDDYQSVAPSHPRLLINDNISDTWDPGYPGGGTSGRLAAIAARANGGSAASAADWTNLRSLAPTGGTPNFGGQDEGSLDAVLAYGVSYLLYHKLGNNASADPYALALYNGLKSGTAYGATYPVYGVSQIVVASNVATVTLSSAPGAEITAGASIGVWGCALAHDAYCGSRTITGVSGSTFTYTIAAANITITDTGMVTTRSYLGADDKGFIGVSLASWSYFYDWCYPWLVTNGHTAEVIQYIKAAYWGSTLTRGSSEFYNNVRESDFHNYTVWIESSILEAGIALNGDDSIGAAILTEGLGYLYQGISVRPASAVNTSYTYNIKASVDAMTEGAMNWEGSTYSRNAVPRILRAIEAFDASTARALDLWNTQFSTAQNFGFYQAYIRDPSGAMAPFGESFNGAPYVGKNNIGLSIINDRFPDPHFVWMMATGINNWNDGTSNAGLVWKLLFYPYVNGPGSHDLTDLPKARRFGADVVIRSGWGSTDTMLTVTGWLPGVYHRKGDSGSFNLYKGNWLVSGSNYKTVEYPVYDGWLKRTISSNSITVYDSTDCWMDNVGTCGVDAFGQKLTNDGGQRTTMRRLNPPFITSEFQISRTWSGSLFTDPAFSTVYNETNGVQFPKLTTGSGYEHVSLDMTKAYTNSYSGSGDNVHAKTALTNGVVRKMVHFQPVGGSIDPVIIFDTVTAANASFPKSWTVHTIGPPQVGPSFVTASSGIASNSAVIMRADNGTSRLYVNSLLPSAPTMRTVGGNSCAPLVVSDATVANPAVFTINGHGLTVGERVAFDVGTYSPLRSNNFNSFGSHPPWILDDSGSREFVVSSVVDANHVIFSIGSSPYDSRIDPYAGGAMPSFASVFHNVGTGAPTIPGFLNKMYYQSDAANGNTTWIYGGSSWIHIGENANGLTVPTLYRHTSCDYSYWVDQFGPSGSPGASLWVFPQDSVADAAKPQWRVEVRPSIATATDYFLNVLTPSSTSDATGPATTSISAPGWHGSQVADAIHAFVAMFPEVPSTSVSYTATHSGAGTHVVTGLSAGTPYPVTQGGTPLGTITTDTSGVLTFAETGGGNFVIGGAPGASQGKRSGRTATSGGVVFR